MAYSTSAPPARFTTGDVGNKYPTLWIYDSTDALTAVRVTGYFTNAKSLGMKKGDVVLVTNQATPTAAFVPVIAINANGSADLSDGTALTVTNTD